MKDWKIVRRFEQIPDLPILAEVDVLVIGGGAAGVAAAETASSMGKDTWLIEKYGFCGGAAVAGLSGTICGMFMASDEENAQPEQVVFGFTERFRQELKKRNGVTEPQKYGKTFTVTHDPLVWREVADDLLESAGVTTLFHTSVTGVIMEKDAFKGVVIESNAGQSIILSKMIVDASGDAAVIARAGMDYYFGDQGRIQNPTMFFRIADVDMEKYLAYYGEDTICPPKVTESILAANKSGEYTLPRHKIWIFPTTRPGELMVNATRLAGQNGRMFNVIDPKDFTEAEVFGRRQVRDYARFLNHFVPGCEDAYVVDTGVEVGIRQTRSIVGVETLTNDDVVNCNKRKDGICRTPWPIELHSGDKPKLHWLINDYYDVPYNTLVPIIGENIIAAGRCLSAEHEALASARVTAQCFEYGHAAGIAAVKAIKENRRIRDLTGEEIRAVMIENGSVL
ncbi:FAD-dependent oxidoreductase [Vibrio cyclitrophicus]|uniref:FAD-dependent oxidoreductase n=1 Tax=Vibrio TaxID=662 RepID=UPI000D35DC89|nr:MULTISPECIES: FAD-dependent oxidoreductase [Vibrio]MCF7507082.1 FAD-dependent oxidoreductase [Vibrio sp. L3-7]PTO52455.1 FAD-dependent oxidoreductase [Vibrio splendidus]PTP05840.1 FAD-dependent oxidoreductase [Vibrio splendidus]PTP45628.1 FAD-dependent oxidoreductase [Vibrio splendidus]PTP96304.1 FAD-dependent oxidoreductase [Vibrio splendidus]